MISISARTSLTTLLCFLTFFLAGCNDKPPDPKSEVPPPAVVQADADSNLVHVDHPDQFNLVAATDYAATSSIQVTGTVNPDISRTIPVISIASGRVVEVHADRVAAEALPVVEFVRFDHGIAQVDIAEQISGHCISLKGFRA